MKEGEGDQIIDERSVWNNNEDDAATEKERQLKDQSLSTSRGKIDEDILSAEEFGHRGQLLWFD